MAYTDSTAVKTYLGISSADDDTLITTLIARAQQMIDSYTDRTFEASTNTSKTFDAIDDVDGDTLYFRRSDDLADVNTITNGDGNAVSTYVLEPRSGPPYSAVTIRSDASDAWTYSTYHENAITVNGKWAYSETPPNDIVHATIRLAAWLYKQKDSSMPIDVPKVSPSGVMMMPMALPKDVKSILDRYRRRF